MLDRPTRGSVFGLREGLRRPGGRARGDRVCSSASGASCGSSLDPRENRAAATPGSSWVRSRSCCSRSPSFSSARCPGSRNGSTGSTGPRSGIAASRSPGWFCSLRTSCCRAARTAPRSADRWARSARSASWHWPLWAILPRWKSVVPAPLRGVIRGCTTRPAPRGPPHPRRLRALAAPASHDRPLRHGGFVHGVLDGTPSTTAPSCGGAMSRSAASASRSTSTASCWRVSSCRCTTTRSRRSARSTASLVEVALRPLGRSVDSSPASSRWSISKPRTAGTAIRSRSPARPTRTCSALPSRRSATSPALQELIEPGMPAVIGGPHGRFSH